MDKLTLLCKIAFKYGTDKCPQIEHNYTPAYFEMFKNKRNTIKKVLEIGIGYPRTMKHVENYQKGASLKMWRDFFPNAQIYGADIAPESLLQDVRISTFVCDENKTEDVESLLMKTGKDLDIFIDDASHIWYDQIFLAKTVLPKINKDVIYIIEDVGWPQHLVDGLKDYECIFPSLERLTHRAPKNRLMIVKNK